MKTMEELKILLKPGAVEITWFDGSQQIFLIFLESGRTLPSIPLLL